MSHADNVFMLAMANRVGIRLLLTSFLCVSTCVQLLPVQGHDPLLKHVTH
jgi:hypothetical protein